MMIIESNIIEQNVNYTLIIKRVLPRLMWSNLVMKEACVYPRDTKFRKKYPAHFSLEAGTFEPG